VVYAAGNDTLQNPNLYGQTDNIKKKIGISVKNFWKSGEKTANIR